MPAEKLSGAPTLPTYNTPKRQPGAPVTRNAQRISRNRSWNGKTAGQVSEEVLRQLQENPERANEIFAKMKASGQKDFAQRVNEVGGGLGPIGRGAVRGAEGIGRFAVNSFLRGMSYIPGLEDWSDQADHNNRLAQIQAAYDTYQDETGLTSEFIGAGGARIAGGLGETASQMVLLGGAGRLAGADSKLGMIKFMAASYGAMEIDRSLTVGKDAGLRGWRANTYAAGNGAITGALTYGFGRFADKFGANTAEELLSRGGGRLANRLMSWNGVKELVIDAALEGGEEEAIALTQNLWGQQFKVNTWEDYQKNAGQAFIGGFATGGLLGVGRKLQSKFNDMVSQIPSAIRGFEDAQKVAETGEKTPEMEELVKTDPVYAKSFDAEVETQTQYRKDAEELGIVDPTRGALKTAEESQAALQTERENLDNKKKLLDSYYDTRDGLTKRSDELQKQLAKQNESGDAEGAKATAAELSALDAQVKEIDAKIASAQISPEDSDAKTPATRAEVEVQYAETKAKLDEQEKAVADQKSQLEAQQKSREEDPEARQRQADEMMKREDARKNAADLEELHSVQIKHLNEVLRYHGVDSFPEVERRKFSDTLQQVWDEGLHLQVMEIVHRTDTNNEVWNGKTKIAVREGIRVKQRQLAEVKQIINSADAASAIFEEALAKERVLDEEITYATLVAKKQQSESGFAFAISKFGDGDPVAAVRRAERIKGGPLTDDETKKIIDKANEVTAIANKIDEGTATEADIKEVNDAAKRVKDELAGEQGEETAENQGPRASKVSTEAEQVRKVLKDFSEYDPNEETEKPTPDEFKQLLSRVKGVLYSEKASNADIDLMVTSLEDLLVLADASDNFSADDKRAFAADVDTIRSGIPHEAWKLRKVVEDYESGKVAKKLDRPEFDKLLGTVRGILNSAETTEDEKTSALNSARRLLNLAVDDTSDFQAQDKEALASAIDTLSAQIKERRRAERVSRIVTDIEKIAKILKRLKNYDPSAPKAKVAADELDTMLSYARKVYTDPNATQEDRDVLYKSVEALQSLATQLGGARPGTPEYEALREAYFVAKHDLKKIQYLKTAKTPFEKVQVGIRAWHESVLTGDLSHMGIQSGMMAVMRPGKYVQAMLEGFQGVKSESEMKTFYRHMSGEFGDLYREGVVTLNPPDGTLSLGEDAGYRGAEDIVRKFSPKAADQIARMQRVYRMGVNAARVNTFEDIVRSWGGRGSFTRDQLFAIGAFTDAITLRGGRGYLDKAVRGLQLGFLAPRNYAAYLELVSLYHIWKPGQTGKVRRAIAWEYGKMLRGWGAMAMAAMVANFFSNLAGNGPVAEVEINPLDKRFMQMKFGNTWIDPSIRLGSYLNTAARSLRAAKTSTTGEKLSQKTGSAYDEMAISSFLRGKESFPVGLAHDLLAGENIVGEPSTPGNVLINRFTPIAPREIAKAAIEGGGPEPLIGSIIEITGFRADFDDPKRRKKNKRN